MAIKWHFRRGRLYGAIWIQRQWGGVGFEHRDPRARGDGWVHPDAAETWDGGFGFGGFAIGLEGGRSK
jgi:hypothetical protein